MVIRSFALACVLATLSVQASALDVWVESQDMATGNVVINGVDTGCWSGPATFDFGDGETAEG